MKNSLLLVTMPSVVLPHGSRTVTSALEVRALYMARASVDSKEAVHLSSSRAGCEVRPAAVMDRSVALRAW